MTVSDMHGHYIDIPVSEGPGSIVVREGFFRRLIVAGAPVETPTGPNAAAPNSAGQRPLSYVERPGALHLVLHTGTSAEITAILLPGASGSLDIDADIAGEGCSLDFRCLCISSADARLSVNTRVLHRMGNSTSRQEINCIASDTSRISFNGTVTVAPGADGTDAGQLSRGILLSPQASVQTEPQLEIYADDVKCSHGTSIGRPDETGLFYMRSRGIPLKEAEVLQLLSLAAPVLDGVPDPAERTRLETAVEEAIRNSLQ